MNVQCKGIARKDLRRRLPTDITVGSQSNVMFSIYNTGKTTLYNVQVKMYADSVEETPAATRSAMTTIVMIRPLLEPSSISPSPISTIISSEIYSSKNSSDTYSVIALVSVGAGEDVRGFR